MVSLSRNVLKFFALAALVSGACALPADAMAQTKTKYDVALRKEGGGNVPKGGTISFALIPKNNGPGIVGGGGNPTVTVIDSLVVNFGAPITFIGTDATKWICHANGQVITCNYIGPPAGPGVMPNIRFQAKAVASGNYTNRANINLNVPDTNPNDNSTNVVSGKVL